MSQALGPDIKIALIDRSAGAGAAPEPDSRASALSAASKRMLEVLGVWAPSPTEAQAVASIEITDSSLEAGVRPVLLTYDNVTGAGEPATYIVPNGVLHQALCTAAEPRAARCSGSHPPRRATLRAARRTSACGSPTARELTAALLVSAEGRNSRLREAAGIKVVGWDYPQIGIVTTVRHERPHEARAVQHFLPVRSVRDSAAQGQPLLHHLDGGRGRGAAHSRAR